MFSRFKKIIDESKEAFYEGLGEKPQPQDVQDALTLFGFNNETDFEQIKSQYKALSKLYHPDTKVNSDSEQFRHIKEAYNVLKLHYKEKQ